MGWLKEAAQQVGISSLAKLASQVCESAARKAEAGHVANMLRKLDKETEVGWWSGAGRAFFEPLAEALNEPVEDLRQRMEQLGRTPEETGRMWTFDVFPALRPLDLDEEPLPPGIPSEVWSPGRAPVWWTAPRGAGRTLVGRWLARRGWLVSRAATWELALASLPAEGRAYVEVESAAAPPGKLDLPDGLRVIVAVPPMAAEPVASRTIFHPGIRIEAAAPADLGPFLEVESPPPAQWMSAVMRWAGARVRPGGGFNAVALESHLGADGATAFATFGDFLAFLGLVDQVGVDALFVHDDAQAERWVRTWLRPALERTDRRLAAEMAGFLRARGVDLLVRMEVARLASGQGDELTRGQWVSLVPADLAPPVDRARLLELADDRDALLAALNAPQADDLVGALVEVGALAGTDTLSLRPAWVSHVLSSMAQERLRASVHGRGALFLHPEAVRYTLAVTWREVADGKLAIVDSILASPAETPEWLAALDGAVRAVGLALASGTAVPGATVRRLWQAQSGQLVDRWSEGLPVPLVRIADHRESSGMSGIGEWVLAALAITKALPDATGPYAVWAGGSDQVHRQRLTSALSWMANVVPPQFLVCADDIEEEDPVEKGFERIALAAFAMGPELLRAVPELMDAPNIIGLLEPAILLARKAAGVEPGTDGPARLPFGLDVLDHVCRAEGVDPDSVIGWCWPTWAAAGWNSPVVTWAQGRRGDWVQRLLAARPAELSASRCGEALLSRAELWPLLNERDWRELLGESDLKQHRRPLWSFVPVAVLVELLRDGHADPWTSDLRREAWARAGAAMLGLVDDWAASARVPKAHYVGDPGDLTHLIWSGPEDVTGALLERAEHWIARPADFPGLDPSWVRRWLAGLVDARKADWRRAFALVRGAE